MDSTYFRFDIELTPDQNPPGTMDRLRQDLRVWLVGRGLGYGMDAGRQPALLREVGPSRLWPSGTVGRGRVDLWPAAQRHRPAHRSGALRTILQSACPITDWVIPVDNLTETERTEAAAVYAELRRMAAAYRSRGD